MAIFSCIHQDDHFATLPRSKSASGRPSVSAVTSPTSPRLISNGPARATSSRDLGRIGGPAKLQKRAKVSKSIIGSPRDFQHLTHMNKTDADKVRNSKEMNEVTAALRLGVDDLAQKENITAASVTASQEPSTAVSNSSEDRVASNWTQSATPSPPANPLQPLMLAACGPAMTVARRKAPPPITPSIIKAAGLPSKLLTPGGVPANATVVVRNNKRTSFMPAPTNTATSDEQALLAPPAPFEASSLPPTNSSIQRTAISDIERLLDAPVDGIPTSSATLDTSFAPGAPLPAHVPEPSGTVRSTTLQNLALSPSMENVVQEAVIVDENQVAKKDGPLEYMTDSTKAKWDGQMEDIARQLREEGVKETQ